jgi:hypothetical protein
MNKTALAKWRRDPVAFVEEVLNDPRDPASPEGADQQTAGQQGNDYQVPAEDDLWRVYEETRAHLAAGDRQTACAKCRQKLGVTRVRSSDGKERHPECGDGISRGIG